MSNNSSSFSSSSYSFSSTSYSSSTTGSGGQPQVSGQRSAQQMYTDADGNTHVRSAYQNLGQAPVTDSRSYDRQGRQLVDASGGTGQGRITGGTGNSGSDGMQGRIQEITDDNLTQDQRDKLYEERIEDEYAKREGGA